MTFVKYALFAVLVAIPTAFIVGCIALSAAAATYANTISSVH